MMNKVVEMCVNAECTRTKGYSCQTQLRVQTVIRGRPAEESEDLRLP
jgi:hypothetical protein